jgi:hypothetical protein
MKTCKRLNVVYIVLAGVLLCVMLPDLKSEAARRIVGGRGVRQGLNVTPYGSDYIDTSNLSAAESDRLQQILSQYPQGYPMDAAIQDYMQNRQMYFNNAPMMTEEQQYQEYYEGQ